MKNTNKYFHLYLLFVECLGGLCFYWGFFPSSTCSYQFSTMADLPFIKQTEIKQFSAYKKHFDKLIIIMIDSLRYDFVAVEEGNEVFFPYLNKLLNNKDSCLLKIRVQSPTVTLPRIKSVLTGTVPGFLDVVANFGKSELNSDNIVKQANENGYNTIFFGDETWINLLPRAFKRSEGTVSFFVNDYVEVDLNVTRNVVVEIEKDDWEIMILHYLGLDHIGHLEGPRSNLVRPKLLEMDNVISLINEKIRETSKRVLLVICGDHGMKDSGGHGGTTLPEVMVPVAILNYGCDKDLKNTELRQIDLAPLLSVLLGIPIPADSIGKLDYKLLNGLEKSYSLYALFYNALRLSTKFMKYNLNETHLSDDIEKNIASGIDFFKRFLNNHSYSDYLNSAKYFTYIQDVLSEKLVSLNVNYDLNLMIFGLILVLQSLFASMFGIKFIFRNLFVKFLFFIISFLLHYMVCYFSESTSITCTLTSFNVSITFFIYLFLLSNLLFINYSIKMLSFNPVNQLLLIGTCLHRISLVSTSYIEEEHQFWYFITVTLFLLCIQKDKLEFCLLLLCHRFLKCLNQTGDKWASLPDLEDWFLVHTNFLLILCLFSVISAFIYSRRLVCNHSTILTNTITAGQYLSIFLYKIVTGSIKFDNFVSTRYFSITLVRIFWVLSLMKIIIYFKSLKNLGKVSYNLICTQITSFMLDTCLIIVSLLFKTHNLIVIPSLLFYSYIFVKHFKMDTFSLIYVHNWLGTLFYFYQGNSNSFSTIDITAGYVGLENFNFYITGLFIALSTFSFPILAHLLLLRALAKNGKLREQLAEIIYINVLIHGSQIVVYSFIMIVQRNHLFIWSVFAPKLLYIMAQILLNALLILLTIFIDFWCDYKVNGMKFFNYSKLR